jgi:hypothetical protein
LLRGALTARPKRSRFCSFAAPQKTLTFASVMLRPAEESLAHGGATRISWDTAGSGSNPRRSLAVCGHGCQSGSGDLKLRLRNRRGVTRLDPGASVSFGGLEQMKTVEGHTDLGCRPVKPAGKSRGAPRSSGISPITPQKGGHGPVLWHGAAKVRLGSEPEEIECCLICGSTCSHDLSSGSSFSVGASSLVRLQLQTGTRRTIHPSFSVQSFRRTKVQLEEFFSAGPAPIALERVATALCKAAGVWTFLRARPRTGSATELGLLASFSTKIPLTLL